MNPQVNQLEATPSVVQRHSSGASSSSVAPGAERGTLVRKSQAGKSIIGSSQKEVHSLFKGFQLRDTQKDQVYTSSV